MYIFIKRQWSAIDSYFLCQYVTKWRLNCFGKSCFRTFSNPIFNIFRRLGFREIDCRIFLKFIDTCMMSSAINYNYLVKEKSKFILPFELHGIFFFYILIYTVELLFYRRSIECKNGQDHRTILTYY